MIEAGQLTLDVFLSKQAAWISQLIAQYGSMSPIKRFPMGQHVRSAAHRRASAPARAAHSGRSRYPDCKGTLPVESGTLTSVAPRVAVAAGRKGPDRPVSRGRALFRRRGPCPARLRVAQRATPSCPCARPVQPSPAAGPEGSFSANRFPRVLLVHFPPLRRVP